MVQRRKRAGRGAGYPDGRFAAPDTVCLEDSDIASGDISAGFASLLEQGKGQIQRLFRQALGGGAALLLIVLLCDGAAAVFQEKDSKLLQCTAMTGALAIVLLSAGSIDQMIGLGVKQSTQ